MTALLALVILAGLAVLFVATATNETAFSRTERDWETAIHAAEAGTDHVAARINEDNDYVTRDSGGNTIAEYDPTSGISERAYALQQAATVTPETTHGDRGEFVGFRPVDAAGDGAMTIYGVGYIPNRANAQRVRVVKIKYDVPGWVPSFAILTNGNLELTGNASFQGEGSNTHSNGDTTGGTNCDYEDDPPTSPSDGNGGGNQVCDRTVNEGGELGVPSFTARNDFYDPLINGDPSAEDEDQNTRRDPSQVGWFELCRGATGGGVIYRVGQPDIGEAATDHANGVNWDETSADRENALAAGPCAWNGSSTATANTTAAYDSTTGKTLVYRSSAGGSFNGWTWDRTSPCSNAIRCWVSGSGGVLDGAYYVHRANVNFSQSAGTGSRRITLIVACDESGSDPARCTTSTGANNGNLYVAGKVKVAAAYGNVQFVADRDLIKEGGSSSDPGALEGLIAVREQFSFAGNATLVGAVVASDEADTTGSWVRRCPISGGGYCGNRVAGDFTIQYDGDLTTPLESTIRVTGWNELSGD